MWKMDSIKKWGVPNRWSKLDEGKTWHEIGPEVAPNADFGCPMGIDFLSMESGKKLDGYKIPSFVELTPGYDFSRKAEEGTLPIQDGVVCHLWGTTIRAYNADRLPPSLDAKEWTVLRIPAGETRAKQEKAKLDWPYLTRVVYSGNGHDNVMKSIFPRGNAKLGPDNAVWITAFSGEGHLNPANGQYTPYYSAELFHSVDGGRSFSLRGHMEYPADGKKYPYQSVGFIDSYIAFMPDGSIIWFFRSAWFNLTGHEVAPMYFSRSTDQGFTWSEPEIFAPLGILPRLCRLGNGKTMLCYARPGIFVRICEDESGLRWSEPLEVMTSGDRSGLANIPVTHPNFYQWNGACNNPELVPLEDDPNMRSSIYSDFIIRMPAGKTEVILARKSQSGCNRVKI